VFLPDTKGFHHGKVGCADPYAPLPYRSQQVDRFVISLNRNIEYDVGVDVNIRGGDGITCVSCWQVS
jgi:hypothetical protein